MTNIVPEGWSCLDLGSHIKIGRGYAFKSEDYKSQGLPIVRVTNIENDGRLNLLNNVVYLDHNEAEKYSNFKLAANDVLIVMVGATVGKLAKVERVYSGVLLNQNMWRLVVKSKSDACQEFLYHSIRPVVDKFLSSQQGSARGFLTQQGFALAEILLPPLPEQQKIATILSSVDDVIEKTRAQIDKLKDLKVGMMQELLTKGIGHTEFKDSPVGRIPVSWNVKQISDVCSEIVDCVNKTAQVVDYVTPYRMIRTTNVRDGRIIMEGMRYVTEDTFNAWSRRLLLQTGDLIFTREAPVGECGLLQESAGLFLGQRTMVYRADTKKIDNIFLLATMQSEYFQAQIEDLSGGSTTPHLRVPDCSKILLKVPSLQEQNKISSSIASVDNAVEKNRNKLEQLSSIKKALMQDLLTGKVRVKLTDLDTEAVS